MVRRNFMVFLHLGDLHLGKSLCDYDLIEDQKYILDQILEIAVKESADGVLIAGDVYDKSIAKRPPIFWIIFLLIWLKRE